MAESMSEARIDMWTAQTGKSGVTVFPSLPHYHQLLKHSLY